MGRLSILLLLFFSGVSCEQSSRPSKDLTLFCAAGVQAPMEKIREAYEAEVGVKLRIQYGGSGTLLSNLQVARTGDLYLAADDSYLDIARKKGLLAESIPIATQRPVIAVALGNPREIASLDDLWPSPWWEFDDARVSDNVYYLEVANIDEIRHTGYGEMKVGPITLERLIVMTSEHADSKFSSINARRFTLTVTDHGNVNIETLDTDQAMLTATSHGDVYAQDVSALDLSMRIEDHGEIWLAGAADTAMVEMRDHGDLDSSRLKCEIVQIQTRNHANASVWVESTLRLQQSDHANVEWIGSPDVRENIALGSN